MERIPRIISTQKAAAAGDGVNTRSSSTKARRMDFSLPSSCAAVNIGSAATAEEEGGQMVSSPRGESRRHVLIGRKEGERIEGVGDGRR